MVLLGIDWGKIFSIPFWLDVKPGELSPLFEKYFLVVFIVSWAMFFLSKYAQKRLISQRNFIKAKFAGKTGSFFLTMAVSFSFIFFFRYEAIPILGGRFWVLVWVLTALIWLFYLLRYYFKVMPTQMSDLAEKRKMSKYLIRPKKKK